jgi:putative transcriptional regulator
MTVSHHPSDELMLDYAAGTMSPALELAIATHLTFCSYCRSTSGLMDSVGGQLLVDTAGTASSAQSFDTVMARISAEQVNASAVAEPDRAIFPRALRNALGSDLEGVPWKRLGMGAYHYVIPVNDPAATARLLRIPAGRPVPVHTHKGTELTVVLCGAFSDATGSYGRGDLQEADDTLLHQPHAAPAEDCVCLAVTQEPLRFESWAARLVQPFLGI